MRLLARLLNRLRSTSDSSHSLSQFLNATYYDAVVEAAEQLAGMHTDENGQRVFMQLSLVLLLGNLLPKYC